MRSFFQAVACVCVLAAVPVFSQQPASGNQPAVASAQAQVTVDAKFVRDRFGEEFTLAKEFQPIVADLDSDGVEDILIVAQVKNPLLDAGPLNYKVVDPYYSFFGFGNPTITTGFASEDPRRRGYVFLVIHGAGAETWHGASPKAKFVLINVPFKEIAGVRRVLIKKKVLLAIAIQEYGGTETTSAVYWDPKGKKYKYEPLGSAMD